MKMRNWESRDSESPFPRRGFGSALFLRGARVCFSDWWCRCWWVRWVAERDAIDVTILPQLSFLSCLFFASVSFVLVHSHLFVSRVSEDQVW